MIKVISIQRISGKDLTKSQRALLKETLNDIKIKNVADFYLWRIWKDVWRDKYFDGRKGLEFGDW